MKIINLSERKKTLMVASNYVQIDAGKESANLIASKDEIRNIVSTNSPDELKLIITNPSMENDILSELGVNPEFIYNEDKTVE